MPGPLSESHVEEAAHTAAIAVEAMVKSRRADIDDSVARGLETFFNRNIESGRFIPMKDNRMGDVERFQFICDQIDGIHTAQMTMTNSIIAIQTNQKWILWLVMGGVTGVAGLAVLLLLQAVQK